MSAQSKIFISIAIWMAVSGFFFGFAFPRLSASLTDLEQSHQQQLSELADLQGQALALEKMQTDLKQADIQSVKISDLFTSDVNLVNEVQHIESISQKTNLTETLTVTGTADKAQVIQSQSGLLNVPYTINLHGSFPDFVNFLKYFENSYFVSPVNAITINFDTPGAVNVTLLSSFLLHK